MKKIILGAITGLLFISATAVIANDHKQSHTAMISMFAKAHDMDDYQQELVLDLFSTIKTTMAEMKEPKAELRAYLEQIAQQDTVNVDEAMQNYKGWQATFDSQLEQVLNAYAKLHENLTPEQRQNVIATMKKMRDKKRN